MLELNRRTLCGKAGDGLLLVFSGGVLRVANAAGALPDGEAYSLWQLWNDRSLHGTSLALVAAAVLAANPHDTQPWLFRVRDDAIEIHADLSRNLGAMDAFVREMHLGLGCAIQNILLAAPPNGFDAAPDVVPGSLLALHDRHSPIRAATIHLTRRAPAPPDSLYRAIPERHTNRYPYNREKPLPRDWKDFARHADVSDDVRVFLIEDGPQRQRFEPAVIEATDAIIADKAMIAASDRWFRNTKAEIEAHRDGPTLDAAGLSTVTLLFAKIFPVSPEMSHSGWRSQTQSQVSSAPLVGLIVVKDRYDRASAIAAGRTWQRLHLSATADGIAMQPLNQPIEMIDRERQTGRGDAWAKRMAVLSGPTWQATFAFRAGYADAAAGPSPRRALKDVVWV